MFEDSTKQATEIISGELLVQAEEIRELQAQIDCTAGVGNGIPLLVNTDTSAVISS